MRRTIYVLAPRGLVEAVEVGPSRAATVQFIHETVREFLLNENGLASISQALAPNVAGISHQVLRIACLRCISMNDMPKDYERYCEASHKTNASLGIFRADMRVKLPFLDYAIAYLLEHAQQAQKNNISQRDFLESQIDANGLWLDPYRSWWNALERYKSRKIKHNVTMIYFVAERKYSHLLAVLLDISDAINTSCGKYRSVLQMSSYYGSQETVKILLDKGADVNAQGGKFGNALQAASYGGHEQVVQVLLDQDADVNTHGGEYGNALQAASYGGHDQMVRLLLEKGAELETKETSGRTPLSWAATNGHEAVVRLLLEKGAELETKDTSSGQTPLLRPDFNLDFSSL
ncbi:hypothetical protein LTR72_011349 [Exophiala xenobiotica]|nr:hypothetical protein LTR72_011349 [Exophiala xenobiotica]KAK5284744.1 hypothetical protein LTR14_011533 [Exophiala xenobiotica]KAK5469101.1 hypothetical protein LTR55_011365 [Exophiala xenobiotica]